MNAKLAHAICEPIMARSVIKSCFSYCSTIEDIREVIKAIPPTFGEFEIIAASEREGYFTIQNSVGKVKPKIVSYDFYSVKEDYYYDY